MLEFVQIGICLAVIYALGGLACSVLHELIAQMFGLRAKNFEAAMKGMLEDNYARVMQHPLIHCLWDASHRRPTAIPGEVVAKAVIHAFEPADKPPITGLAALQATLPASLQRQIVPFIDDATGDARELEKAARAWFDASMTSAEDWYAQNAHWLSVVVAVVFAVAFNIDTLHIASTLAKDSAQRSAVAQLAVQFKDGRVVACTSQEVAKPTAASPSNDGPASTVTADSAVVTASDDARRLAACTAALQKVGGNLIGWQAADVDAFMKGGWPMALLGWLASGLAMSLGARFWFDTLSNLVSMRAGLAPADFDKAGEKPA